MLDLSYKGYIADDERKPLFKKENHISKIDQIPAVPQIVEKDYIQVEARDILTND